MTSPVRPTIVWRFGDGKAGHENQSRGLLESLARLRAVKTVEVNPLPAHTLFASQLLGCPASWQPLPTPDLLVGAGHRTHLSLLSAGRFRGGKTIVLMRPSLPLSFFDLCLIPAHDDPPRATNILATRGVLNRIQTATAPDPHQGLLLIGGTSTHFGWDNAQLLAQITTILAADSAMQWTLTTSRRTPASFLGALDTLAHRIHVVPVTATTPDWLPQQLAQAGQVWVTADSVSMIYESLTAGAAVGILEVPCKRTNRVSRGLRQLASEGWITTFESWQKHVHLQRPPQAFNEAERCAHWIHQQWLT
ncbi:MAG: nucleoside-diphosphate sugar epimerase [Candidatus Contendobacter odensis]|uniref:Nucleoside-diphosphate sugar epimerase n=1 Tax=Candidatus Contendibacter odensensis TaxID=1400860 RepID=A0A2G6PDX4_9GAMM|nr:MAG: nucleoside-diphosphate sugar epimerase [Candidatus Contendobacter odensis]